MCFQTLNIKPEYRSLRDDLVLGFYIPALSKSVLYKRAVGYFSSTALIEISHGITGLLKNNGKILLIASPMLQKDDIEAINMGYKQRNQLIEQALVDSIMEPKNYFESERLNLLANLISTKRLDIKIAFTESNNGIGIYHEKMGLLYDEVGNKIAFAGSLNETASAYNLNYETIDVYRSWKGEEERVLSKENAFHNLWLNQEINVRVVEFPDLAKEKLLTYKKDIVNWNIDEIEYKKRRGTIKKYYLGPLIPEEVNLYDYQIEAIRNWEKQNFTGVFDMATGTGKTYTALGAISRLYYKLNKNLAIIIVCPYQHLVEQWVEDIKAFNMKPIIGYSSSRQRDWKRRLKDAVNAFNLNLQQHFCFITTNKTFSLSFAQEEINKLKGNVLLVVDEAHNFGADNLSESLTPKIPFRLALSATIERYRDEIGTEKILSYFGEKCIEYTLDTAIRQGKLTPYYYYPTKVYLHDDELEDYKQLSAQIAKHTLSDGTISETGKYLLIKRAMILAGARDKLLKLEELMKDYTEASHVLIYCGATTIKDINYKEGKAEKEEIRQIDAVKDILGNKLNIRVSQFTSQESAQEREIIKREFAKGSSIQALVAIRCLDEGVNIPSIKTAFILASSTNPKEYIQRRGRVLRKAPGKKHAVIFDFITLPRPCEQVKNLTEAEAKEELSIVKKEINRMSDFASIAENASDADRIIDEIKDSYNMLRIGEI